VVYRAIADRHPRLELWLAWPRGVLDVPGRAFLDLARRRAA
jgi:hypothetical protein